MIIGVIGWDIEIFDSGSLKQKRRVVKSLKGRLHSRFNLSAAETGKNELWQRAELTACGVANDRRHLDAVLEKADRLVASDGRVRIIDSYRTFY